MPFGLSKKDKDAELAAQKSSLFGGRSSKVKTSSPAPSSANPYAVPAPSSDPYANSANPYATQSGNDPYAPPTQSMGSLSVSSQPPPSYGAPNIGTRTEKSPVPPGGYGGGQPRFQSQGGHGQSGGYGSDPYGPPAGSSRPGGYGGIARTFSDDTISTDAGRNALFGNAPTRAVQQSQQPLPPAGDSSYTRGTGGYDSTEMPGGYGGDRQLTAEEQEEEDVQAVKDQIRSIKREDIAILNNTRRVAEQTEALAYETLARLGQQGDRIHNTERNLDMASNQNRLAEEKARELKTLNRNMFAVHVANPFTAKKREEAANAIALEKHQRERAQRDATAAAAYSSTARHQAQQRDLNGNIVRKSAQRSLADRSKYQFEAESDDDRDEDVIDDHLDTLVPIVKNIHLASIAMGDEADSQNKHIGRIINKTDKVDDQIAVNRARLERISKRG